MGSSVFSLMIEKCAQTIENVIIPALNDESVVVQAQYTAAILHTLAPVIEEKSKELIEENRAMREVLGKARKMLYRKPLSSNSVWTELVEALDRQLTNRAHIDVLEENHCLKGVLVRTIKDLDCLSVDLGTKTISSLKRNIRIVLRQQLDHSLAFTMGFQGKI